jgi:hypothetical protein
MTEEQIENLEWDELTELLDPIESQYIDVMSSMGIEVYDINYGNIGFLDAAVCFSGKIVNSKLFRKAYDNEMGKDFPSLKGLRLTTVVITGWGWDSYRMVIDSKLSEEVNNAILTYLYGIASGMREAMNEYIKNY